MTVWLRWGTWWSRATPAVVVMLGAVALLGQMGGWVWTGEPSGVPTAPAPLVAPVEIPAAVVEPVETSPSLPADIEGAPIFVDTAAMPAREIDESEAPLQLLPDVVGKILFGREGFQYDAKGRPDPMIIPWIRQEQQSIEHIIQAGMLRKEALGLTDPMAWRERYDQAIGELDLVIKFDPTGRYGQDAQRLKTEIVAERKRREDQQAGIIKVTPTPVAKIPPEIATQTRGVIFDNSSAGRHLVLWGDDVLRVGDTVPKYPTVKIVEVARDRVTYEYEYEPGKMVRVAVSVEIEVRR